ncbi:MAG TPA: class I SAM-dependent methyltransferase [Actinomycetota bacterium]|nr:class I SAM-dependent methyltransferase [Actinomycetota bacterium]
MEKSGEQAQTIQKEFERAAAYFTERTQGRFDSLDVVNFSRIQSGARVLEVGVGTGSFLQLFAGRAGSLVGVDLTFAMLEQGSREKPDLQLVVGDGNGLPFRSQSFDLVASAQTFHHIARPVPVLREMARVVAAHGRVLVVDQVAPEHYEEMVAMTELETLRDPSHAASRSPSAMRLLIQAAGLELIDERIVSTRESLTQWMWPGEFPLERIGAVRDFVAKRGPETGMAFESDGDDYTFERRRMALLAEIPRTQR